MVPPFISYVTFNRLGLTVVNLKKILDSSDDFEMHIVDNHSTDGTWEYLNSINDSRIKSKTQIPVNSGPIYALNMNLIRRQPDQYFIALDNDVYIETEDWITCFMKVFDTFPEVGLLGVQRENFGSNVLPNLVAHAKDNVLYLELEKSSWEKDSVFIPGGCQCLRPELIKEIGYWSEENGFGNVELSFRVTNFTLFKAGFVPNIITRIPQDMVCTGCPYQGKCQLDKSCGTCFHIYHRLSKHNEFEQKFYWKLVETFKDMESGVRPVYCASALDGDSYAKHLFNMEWALENFRFYVNYAN